MKTNRIQRKYAYKMESTDIASKILENVEIVANIYEIIRKAGYEATRSREVIFSKKNTSIIKANEIGINRLSPCMESKRFTITYYPNDIIIIGSMALNIYNYVLNDFKQKNKILASDNYITKKTTDIDIVWWPHTFDSEYIITSESRAIRELVKMFKSKLTLNFSKSENLVKIKDLIKKSIRAIKNIETLSITVESMPEYKEHLKIAGIWTIRLNLTIGRETKKICDIVIHDSGASQKYDKDGELINRVEVAESDPIYGSNTNKIENTVSYLNIRGIYIAVPNLLVFIRQQMFAFDNSIRDKNTKAFIYYKRSEFIRILINKFDLSDKKNRLNFTSIFKEEYTNKTFVEFLSHNIRTRIYESISKYYLQIIDLCRLVNLEDDKIIASLYDDSILESQKLVLYNFKLDEIDRLEKYKQDLKTKLVSTNSEEYNLGYIKIQKKINALQEKIENMSLRQLSRHKLMNSIKMYATLDKQIQVLEEDIAKEIIEKSKVITQNSSELPSIYILPEYIEYAPNYLPPKQIVPYYVEPSTGRYVRYDSRGFWYYIPQMVTYILHISKSIQTSLPKISYTILPNLPYSNTD